VKKTITIALVTVSLAVCSLNIKAQIMSFNEPNRKNLKSVNATSFNVILSAEENPLSFTVKINNPTKEPIKLYLRNRNESNLLVEKEVNNDGIVLMTLHFSTLEDGEYTFVVRNTNHFFIKQFFLQSGDLSTTRINGKDVMTTNRTISFGDK
jgi:protein tyrosine/serine phosphatase